MRLKGKITQWDDDKGFGFIQPMLKGDRVFLHVKALQNRARRPQVGEVVTYTVTVAKDKQGRNQAQTVTYAGEKPVIKSANATNYWPLKLVLLFFIALALLHWLSKLPLLVLAVYAGLSLITFISYAWDKRQAQAAGRRTPESTLHLMALLGGWPGAWLAQQHLRHKSQKISFLRVFWCTLLLNLGLFLYLFTFFWW